MHWFSSVGFAAHGASFLWMPSLLWTYAVSDALIGLSYCSIPFGIAYFMRRRAAFEFNWMYALAADFLCSCFLCFVVCLFYHDVSLLMLSLASFAAINYSL